VFRQLVFRAVTSDALSTDDLLEELFDVVKRDAKLRYVLAREASQE